METFKNESKPINTHFIYVDTDYQRILNPSQVKRIVKDFNPNLVQEPRVSYRCGKYYVFDGQHTIAALKELNGGKDLMIDCRVFYGMTKKEEAVLFGLQKGSEKRVTICEKLNSFNVGGDRNVQDFIWLVQQAGFTCDFQNYSGDGRLNCYSTAFTIFNQQNGRERLRDILEIIRGAWDLSAGGIRKEIVNGLNLALKDNAKIIDKNRMIKKLNRVSPVTIIRTAQEKTKGGNKRYEQAIVDIYNSKLRSGERLIVK